MQIRKLFVVSSENSDGSENRHGFYEDSAQALFLAKNLCERNKRFGTAKVYRILEECSQVISSKELDKFDVVTSGISNEEDY